MVYVMKHCRSSAGLRTASLSTPVDLSVGIRPRKEFWRWPGGPCRLLPSHLPMATAEGVREDGQQHILFWCSVFREEKTRIFRFSVLAYPAWLSLPRLILLYQIGCGVKGQPNNMGPVCSVPFFQHSLNHPVDSCSLLFTCYHSCWLFALLSVIKIWFVLNCCLFFFPSSVITRFSVGRRKMTTIRATSIFKARGYRGLTFQALIHIDIWAVVDRFIGSPLTLNAALQRVGEGRGYVGVAPRSKRQ